MPPRDWEEPRKFPPQVGTPAGKYAAEEEHDGQVGILLEEAMMEVGLEEMETYVPRRHNSVAQFITTRPILKLCLMLK